MSARLERGLIVMVGLDPVRGHEQAGVRPAIVISDPACLSESRFPLTAVIPVTCTAVKGDRRPGRSASGSATLAGQTFGESHPGFE